MRPLTEVSGNDKQSSGPPPCEVFGHQGRSRTRQDRVQQGGRFRAHRAVQAMPRYGNGSGDFGLVRGVEAAAVVDDAMHQRFVSIWDDVRVGDHFSPSGFCLCGGPFPTLGCTVGVHYPRVIFHHVLSVGLQSGVVIGWRSSGAPHLVLPCWAHRSECI